MGPLRSRDVTSRSSPFTNPLDETSSLLHLTRQGFGAGISRSKNARELSGWGVDLFSKAPRAGEKALSVTQLLRRMKNLLEEQLGEVWVEGEVSNLKKQGSGHWYFSLKDAGGQIQCAMFGAGRRPGAGALEDGAKVRVFAETSVYEARGQLQIIVQSVERAGVGDLQARFEALKRKLHAEGLFDAERKRAIPKFPQTIGIITSASGAALQDILNVLTRRAPWVQPVLFPVRVQGRGAELEIAGAIGQLGWPEKFGLPRCDVIIVGRGGGSIEDLWNFNEEAVARAMAACPIPIISAVGHEIDFTIADFVADLRAPTPSAAAELAVADGVGLFARLAQWQQRLERLARERLLQGRRQIDALKRGVLQRDGEKLLREPMLRLDSERGRLAKVVRSALESAGVRMNEARAGHRAQHPSRVLERREDALTHMRRRLEMAGKDRFKNRHETLEHLRGLWRALGPESAFRRGFSITLGEDGKTIRSVENLHPGTLLRTKFIDGETLSRVEKKS